jgi:hypothetical protein
VVVELAGELSEDCDLDADHGALLIHPDELVSVEPLDAEVVRSISNRAGEEDEFSARWILVLLGRLE